MKLAFFLVSSLLTLQSFAYEISVDELGQQATEVDKKVEQAMTEQAMRDHDQAILNSMDNLDGALDLLELDRQQQIPKLDEATLPKEDTLLIEDDGLLIDEGFDDLDIEAELLEDAAEDPFEVIELPQELNKDIKATKSIKPKAGVGVQGEEEQIINQLDKSDLMDVETEVELWLEPIEPPLEIQAEIDDIE